MAWLQVEASGNYHISFRFDGKKYKRSLKTKNQAEANGRKARLEETVRLIESGRLAIAASADIVTYLLTDGKLTCNGHSGNGEMASRLPVNGNSHANEIGQQKSLTVKSAFTRFFKSIPEGNLEECTLEGMHMHKRHLLRILKPGFELQKITVEDLQNYVNKR